MNGKKIIATLVVLTMVLSTVVVLKQLDVIKEASAQPGVDDWGMATTDLFYMQGGDSGTAISFNTSNLNATTTYYLYKPRYNCSTASIPEKFEWDADPVTRVNGLVVSFTTAADPVNKIVSLGIIRLDRAGIWMIGTSPTSFEYGDFFWVNTSQAYTIDPISDFTFGDLGSKTITVKEGDSAVSCFVDLIDPEGTLVFHEWTDTPGSYTFGIDGNITMAGQYTVRAYRDLDTHKIMYQYEALGEIGYDNTHGENFATTPDGYDYDAVGPWDPPEKNATERKFTVRTAKPTIVLTNTTVFWGQKTRIDINVTGADGKGIKADNPEEAIKLRFGSKYLDDDYFYLEEGTKDGDYWIGFRNWMDEPQDWLDLSVGADTANINGTWRVVFGYDSAGDETEEYNNSATFSISRSDPPVRIVVIDPEDKKIDVPEYVTSSYTAGKQKITFEIFGTSVQDEDGRAYYGDDDGEDYKNISITGDILYPVDEDTLEWDYDGVWDAWITPVKPNGKITITINWPGAKNGTASQTIDIVDGIHVIPAVTQFTVGNHYNLTVSIRDTDGTTPLSRAKVWLMWEPDDRNTSGDPILFDSTHGRVGNNTVGNGRNGEYTFWIKPEVQVYAPRKLTIAAELSDGAGIWGYATVSMMRNHNMKVDVTPMTSFAGDATEYDITVSLLAGGNPAKADLNVSLYNDTGVFIPPSHMDWWSKLGEHTFVDEEIPLSAGTYYISAYNDTHDSWGNNATIVVTAYTITCAPNVLAWLVDTAVNMTFQVTPTRNGTLALKNVSGASEAAIDGQESTVFIEDGIGILNEVDATTLGNVTFEFTPEGGYQRPAQGLLRVTTATATPNPSTIYLGELTVVTVTVTHPATGAPLRGVVVGLDINESIETVLTRRPTNTTTDAQGRATFAVNAEASGNVTIYLQNETDPDNPFIIKAAVRKTMVISTSPSVDEGATFTVSARSGGELITDATVTFVFNGQTYTTTTGSREITAPSVSTTLSYPITATAEGYTDASTNIMVINVPRLVIIPPSTTPSGTQIFTVTIANDQGAGVAGALVMFDGKEHISGVNGICELTAPDVKEKDGAVYTISATFTGYASAQINQKIEQTKGIPGFELLTLIAAIGVAFLLLRRRRK